LIKAARNSITPAFNLPHDHEYTRLLLEPVMILARIGSSARGGVALIREILHTPRSMPRHQIRWTIAVSLLVGVVFATVSRVRLGHTLHTVHFENIVFGADNLDNFKGIVSGRYGVVGARKHALAQIVFAVLTAPQKWLGVSARASAVNTLALVVGIFGASFLVLCIRIGASLALAVAACLFVFATNAFAFQTALFETYILTALVSTLALLLYLELADHVTARPVWCAIFAGTAAGMAGLANTSAAAIALVYSSIAWSRLARRSHVSRALLSIAVPCAISLSCAMLPSVLTDFLHHDAPLQWAMQYTSQWGNLGNFSNASLTADYAATFLIFDWVSVGVEPICRYTGSDVGHLAHAPWALLGLVGGLALVAYAARQVVRQREALPLVAGFAIVYGVFFTFYWYFNPWEGMLYSCQWMLMIVCLVVLGLKRVRGAAIAVLVVALAMLVSNEPLTWPTRQTFEQACPDDHLPPWEQGPNPATPRTPDENV
jgi:hypothetical protein